MALSFYHSRVILSTPFDMSGRLVLVVIAILVGTSLFGIYKSLELLSENSRLGHSVSFLTTELEGAKNELKAVRSDLSESRMINAQLEDDAADLKGKLTKAQTRLAKFEEYAILLRRKYGEVLVKAKELDEANRRMGERSLRLNLENEGFRMKFSSEKGLKEALRDLRRQKRASKKRPPAPKKKFLVSPPVLEVRPEPVAAPEAGNQGFLVKDGRSTIEQLVDIRVESVPSPGLNMKGD